MDAREEIQIECDSMGFLLDVWHTLPDKDKIYMLKHYERLKYPGDNKSLTEIMNCALETTLERNNGYIQRGRCVYHDMP